MTKPKLTYWYDAMFYHLILRDLRATGLTVSCNQGNILIGANMLRNATGNREDIYRTYVTFTFDNEQDKILAKLLLHKYNDITKEIYN